jgi:hypothetical protein
VPFESFYKTFKHPGAVLSPRPPSDSDEHTGDEDAVLTPSGVPACCPESINTYLEMCQKYSTDANAGSAQMRRPSAHTHMCSREAMTTSTDSARTAMSLMIRTQARSLTLAPAPPNPKVFWSSCDSEPVH